MPGIGKTVLSQRAGRPVRLSADGYPEWKPVGVTVAWELITAAAAPATLADGTTVAVGEKVIEVGTPMVRVTSGPGAGKYAPVVTTNANGQQTLTRGEIGLLDNTIKQTETAFMGINLNNELTGLIEGGLVWKQRLKVGGAGQATQAALLAAMPRITITPDQ